MGAIAVFLPERGDAAPQVIEAMCAAAPHRGQRVDTLVHGRCAIACSNTDDLADAVIGIRGDLAVAFVGTLDNAADLARELEPAADTELLALLAAGFRVNHEGLAARLRGVFAVAVSDGTSVWCARDHLGYRPLFYRRDARGFFAATEAKQIVAGAGIPREPDPEVVERIFFRTVTDETPCALRGVNRLPKATGIMSDGAGTRLRRYWEPERLLETGRYSSDELQDRFNSLMDQAVTRSLTGHDAVSLSGGIDSPAIAAFAAPRHLELSGTPLHAISVVYPKYPSVDESRYVALLADAFGMPLHTYEQSVNPLADLAYWTRLADTPFPGAALAHYAEDYQRARALGFRTILSGEHAEFVFALHWNTLDHYLSHGRWSAARRLLAARHARGESWLALARLAGRAISPDWLLAARNAIGRRRPPTVPRWMDAKKAAEEEPVPVRERWRHSQLLGFIGPGMALEAEEVCQAVSGVRTRRPWTDVDLWELFLSLPAQQKFPDLRAKGLVRDLLRGRVPDAVLDRKDKTVFDEAAMAEVDYATLRRYLLAPAHRIPGVRYALLGRLIETESLSQLDFVWARELANAHAFLSEWDR